MSERYRLHLVTLRHQRHWIFTLMHSLRRRQKRVKQSPPHLTSERKKHRWNLVLIWCLFIWKHAEIWWNIWKRKAQKTLILRCFWQYLITSKNASNGFESRFPLQTSQGLALGRLCFFPSLRRLRTAVFLLRRAAPILSPFHCRKALNLLIKRGLRLFYCCTWLMLLWRPIAHRSTMETWCKLRTSLFHFFCYFLFSRAQQLKISVNYAVIRMTTVRAQRTSLSRLPSGFRATEGGLSIYFHLIDSERRSYHWKERS